LGGAPDLDEAALDAERMGFPAEIVAELAGHEAPGIEVWPDNMPVADAWLIVCTQWNTVSLPSGQVLYHGLRYGDAKVALDAAEVFLRPAQWSGLRLMERAASAALNGQRG
jgi:hypothetical protein